MRDETREYLNKCFEEAVREACEDARRCENDLIYRARKKREVDVLKCESKKYIHRLMGRQAVAWGMVRTGERMIF